MKFVMRSLGFIFLPIVLVTLMFLVVLFGVINIKSNQEGSDDGTTEFVGEFTGEVPIFSEIKGNGNVPDEIAQLAVGTAIKYKLLPSVILSQWAYESEWGRSYSAKNDLNYFGITWTVGIPYPKGSARGVGGSEGGYYVKFPSTEASFSYYGYMVSSQSNFNASVGKKSPAEVLLILGRGGYASAGITESSSYFKGAMAIIENNNLTKYDDFAIQRWGSSSVAKGATSSGSGKIDELEKTVGQQLYNGECYGLVAYYVDKMGGPKLMGSGYSYAERIGEDYDWEKYGWQVIKDPKVSDLKAGDIVNWYAGGVLSPGIYGHTGVISKVNSDGTFDTYEQNAGKGRINAKYTRTYEITRIRSLVRKK